MFELQMRVVNPPIVVDSVECSFVLYQPRLLTLTTVEGAATRFDFKDKDFDNMEGLDRTDLEDYLDNHCQGKDFDADWDVIVALADHLKRGQEKSDV